MTPEHSSILNHLRGETVSESNNQLAKPVAERADEITEDEIRNRAKAIVLRNGWLEQKAPPQLPSIIELMVALGLDVLKNPPASCGYPECGCDFDAVCNAALASPAAISGEGSGAVTEALIHARDTMSRAADIIEGERLHVEAGLLRRAADRCRAALATAPEGSGGEK